MMNRRQHRQSYTKIVTHPPYLMQLMHNKMLISVLHLFIGVNQTSTESLESKLTFRAARCLPLRIFFLTESLHFLIGPFKSWAVMKGRIKSAIVHIWRQECSILYQEFHSIPIPLFCCNVERCPWFKERTKS